MVPLSRPEARAALAMASAIFCSSYGATDPSRLRTDSIFRIGMPRLYPSSPALSLPRASRFCSGAGDALQHGLQLAHELVDVLELAVHRRESHVRHVIDPFQLPHDEIADLGRFYFPVVVLVQLDFDPVDDVLDRLQRHGPLLARRQQPALDLLPVENVAPPVLLDDVEGDLLDLLIRREPFFARQTFPAPPHGCAGVGRARIDDLVVIFLAERTAHEKELL